MTSQPTPDQFDDGDIHTLLASRQQVAVIWCTEDVQSLRPSLTDDQAWEVLRHCKRAHDCEIGLNWTLIETVADHMYPSLTEENDQ